MAEEGKGQSRLGLARVRVQDGWAGRCMQGHRGTVEVRVGPGTGDPQPLLCWSWCPHSTDENSEAQFPWADNRSTPSLNPAFFTPAGWFWRLGPGSGL